MVRIDWSENEKSKLLPSLSLSWPLCRFQLFSSSLAGSCGQFVLPSLLVAREDKDDQVSGTKISMDSQIREGTRQRQTRRSCCFSHGLALSLHSAVCSFFFSLFSSSWCDIQPTTISRSSSWTELLCYFLSFFIIKRWQTAFLLFICLFILLDSYLLLIVAILAIAVSGLFVFRIARWYLLPVPRLFTLALHCPHQLPRLRSSSSSSSSSFIFPPALHRWMGGSILSSSLSPSSFAADSSSSPSSSSMDGFFSLVSSSFPVIAVDGLSVQCSWLARCTMASDYACQLQHEGNNTKDSQKLRRQKKLWLWSSFFHVFIATLKGRAEKGGALMIVIHWFLLRTVLLSLSHRFFMPSSHSSLFLFLFIPHPFFFLSCSTVFSPVLFFSSSTSPSSVHFPSLLFSWAFVLATLNLHDVNSDSCELNEMIWRRRENRKESEGIRQAYTQIWKGGEESRVLCLRTRTAVLFLRLASVTDLNEPQQSQGRMTRKEDHSILVISSSSFFAAAEGSSGTKSTSTAFPPQMSNTQRLLTGPSLCVIAFITSLLAMPPTTLVVGASWKDWQPPDERMDLGTERERSTHECLCAIEKRQAAKLVKDFLHWTYLIVFSTRFGRGAGMAAPGSWRQIRMTSSWSFISGERLCCSRKDWITATDKHDKREEEGWRK